MRFATLASGSKGNAALVEHGSNLILVDCGLSGRMLEQRMQQLETSIADLSAILLTHAHSDHHKGLNTVVKKSGLTPYMSQGAAKLLELSTRDYQRITAGQVFTLADGLAVTPITIPHDSLEPLMFKFSAAHARLGLATDIGAPNDYLVEQLNDCGVILLECNYDPQMLSDNIKYPPMVKQRISGNTGHLSNEQAGELLARIAQQDLRLVVAGHLSENNNLPELALDALKLALRTSAYAPALEAVVQHSCSKWFEVTAAAT